MKTRNNIKSSLKTFLAGKNPFELTNCCGGSLVGTNQLVNVVGANECGDSNSFVTVEGNPFSCIIWFIDVLDDGTAITYCKNN